MTRAIVETLSAEWVRFPSGPALLECAKQFEMKGRRFAADGTPLTNGIPQVVAAVDGRHIPIKTPPGSGDQYFGRKGYATLNTQLVFGHDLCIYDCSVGWSGRTHDARVWRESLIGRSLDTGAPRALEFRHYARDINGVSVPLMIAGNSAYEAGPFMLPQFSDYRTHNPIRNQFRAAHGSQRIVAECGKNRFRGLLWGLDTKLETTCYIIMACRILHSICIAFNCAEPTRDAQVLAEERAYRELWAAGGVGPPLNCALGDARARHEGARIRDALVDFVASRSTA